MARFSLHTLRMTKRQYMTDYLRGIAALMVCVCHFRHALPAAWREYIYTGTTLGVQIFFVISGFIIPYSLARSDYKITAYPRFLLKRLLRLQPPLIAALVITFILSHAAIWYKDTGTANFDLSTLLRTALYMDIPDENPVVWTLIIEAKYYLFVGLLYPLFFSRDTRVRLATFSVAALASATALHYVPDLKHLPLFLMGFAACQYMLGFAGRREAIALALVAAASATPGLTALQIIIGLVTAVLVTVPCGPKWKVGLFFGTISYSLYLVHFPVGVKFLNLTLPHLPWPWYRLMLFGAFGFSIAVAYLLWKYVENPAAEWSQKISLKPRRAVAEPIREAQSEPVAARKD